MINEWDRPTVRRRKADVELVFAALRKTKAAEYREDLNPFPEGLRHDRFERLYKRERLKWIDMEARFDELAEVYGEFRPDRIGLLTK